MGKRIQQPRVMYLEYLRILATFAVIVIHSLASAWENIPVSGNDWLSLTVYDSLVRWCVPVFVMISGSLFLDNNREITYKKLFSKYILRIVLALCFWSFVYGFYYAYKYDHILDLSVKMALRKLLSRTIAGSFHLWFLFMIIGLYLIVPVLRKITESKKSCQYFIIVSIIFTFVIPSLIIELNKLNNPDIKAIITNYYKMNFHLTLGYSGYFVMGYYFANYDIGKWLKRAICVLALVGFATTIIPTIVVSRKANTDISTYFGYLTANVMMQSIGVFVFGKEILSKIKVKGIGEKIILALSKYSFGVYLVHLLVIKFLQARGFDCMKMHWSVSPFIYALIVFVMSIVLSMILNNIPIVKKYLV